VACVLATLQVWQRRPAKTGSGREHPPIPDRPQEPEVILLPWNSSFRRRSKSTHKWGFLDSPAK